jgi:hypothetical protein
LPAPTEAAFGVAAIEIKVGPVTVKFDDPLIFPEVAVMFATPAATAVANPVCSLTVATVVFDEVQPAVVVRSCVEPSL